MTDVLDLFAAPDLRVPAPSAPGSASSHAAALDLSSPFRRASWRKIMLTLASSGTPLSREELSEATGLPVNVICARVSDLMPMYVESAGRCRGSHAKPGLMVEGLRLTPAGRKRCGV